MLYTEPDDVLAFIKHFQNEGTIKTFTEGCCYWFAKILDERFNWNNSFSGIMYNPVDNHFATAIDCRLYDITGQIPWKLEDWSPWEEYMTRDELETEHIIRDCIYKES